MQETGWQGSKARSIKGRFKLFYRKIIKEKCANSVVKVNSVSRAGSQRGAGLAKSPDGQG